jgi:ankyrin repeat protein
MTLGDLATVQKLIKNGADPNILNPMLNGRPIWFSALLMGQKSVFYAMSEHMTIAQSPERSLGQIGPDALAAAAARGYADVVQMLLEKGVDINGRQFVGTTAILVAASNANEQIVKLLLDRHADPNIADQHGDTALMAAVRAGSLPIVKALLARGADPKGTDKKRRTAVWWVARTDRTDILKELIQHGADINVADKSGSTPLMQAARMGRVDMAKALRAKGASGSVVPHSPRPLLTAIERSLPLIQSRGQMWFERTKCLSCHHTYPSQQATLLAKQYGLKINEKIAETQLTAFSEFLSDFERGHAKAAVSREASAATDSPSHQEDRSRSLAAFLGSVPPFSTASTERFENMARVLANLQFEDGRWIHGLARVPIESSDVLTTAYAIRALQLYGPGDQRQKINKQIARATEWLKHVTATTTDDLLGKLYGFYWMKADAQLHDVTQQLLRQQKADGSWAQKPGMNGDAYATGITLFALHETQRLHIQDPAYKRGVEFLLRTQEDDGSWLVPTRAIPLNGYLESGSPHDKHQFISFAATCWATMALTVATRE